MWVLIAGLIIFFSVHLLPSFTTLRSQLVAWKGEGVYQMGYSVCALTGLSLIIYGKSIAPVVAFYDPPAWTFPLNGVMMWFAVVFFPAAYLPTNLKRVLRHPFLWGVTLWAVAHLLVNGDLASLLLFASFAIFALFDMWSSNRRGATFSGQSAPLWQDGLLVALGTVVYTAVIHLHPYIFGAPVYPY